MFISGQPRCHAARVLVCLRVCCECASSWLGSPSSIDVHACSMSAKVRWCSPLLHMMLPNRFFARRIWFARWTSNDISRPVNRRAPIASRQRLSQPCRASASSFVQLQLSLVCSRQDLTTCLSLSCFFLSSNTVLLPKCSYDLKAFTGWSTLCPCAQIAEFVVLRLGPAMRTRVPRSKPCFHHCLSLL